MNNYVPISDNGKSRTLEQYLKEIRYSKTQPLSTEEEAELARRIKKGDLEARNKLVEGNLLFVVSIARQYLNKQHQRGKIELDLEDLISIGNAGLFTAAERFDETRGFKFISYAVWWIRQAILQALKEQTRTIRLPMNRVDDLIEYRREVQRRVQQKFEENPEQDPDYKMIAEEVEEERFGDDKYFLPEISKKPLSLNRPFSEDSEDTLLNILSDDSQPSPDQQTLDHALGEDIAFALETLDKREREIISLYFGLNGTPDMNLEQIGSKLGVTRERVRQIKEKALRKLRDPSFQYPQRGRLRKYVEE